MSPNAIVQDLFANFNMNFFSSIPFTPIIISQAIALVTTVGHCFAGFLSCSPRHRALSVIGSDVGSGKAPEPISVRACQLSSPLLSVTWIYNSRVRVDRELSHPSTQVSNRWWAVLMS